jgi:hypothetical protein
MKIAGFWNVTVSCGEQSPAFGEQSPNVTVSFGEQSPNVTVSFGEQSPKCDSVIW